MVIIVYLMVYLLYLQVLDTTPFQLVKDQYYKIHDGYPHTVVATLIILDSTGTPIFKTGTIGIYYIKVPITGCTAVFSYQNIYLVPADLTIEKITDYLPLNKTLHNTLSNTQMLTLGDSIPARGQFQLTMLPILGLKAYNNKAVAGRQVSDMIFDRISLSVGSNNLIEPSVLQTFKLITIGGHANNYASNVPIGTLNDEIGTKEVDTLNITGSAISSGNITITLNSLVSTIAVVDGDQISDIITKIKTALIYNWAMSGDSPNIVFTKRIGGINSAPTFSGGTTGVTGTFSVTNAGTAMAATFYAQCKFALTYLLENAPLAKIVAYGAMLYKGYFEGNFGTANTAGLVEKDYEDAWRSVQTLRNSFCGINA